MKKLLGSRTASAEWNLHRFPQGFGVAIDAIDPIFLDNERHNVADHAHRVLPMFWRANWRIGADGVKVY
jgi:hypothetical protein